MRAFFLKDGRIRRVEMLSGLSDQEAVRQAKAIFSDCGDKFDGFEVWQETRQVHWEGRRFTATVTVQEKYR
ncbi:MAG: hypothetical protein JO288_19570 [Hyphomicrobiales bacterium]|nr:hypothetical protein [Hyphomicrobiales bacterium]